MNYSWREESKKNYGSTDQNEVTDERIKTGAIMRIASESIDADWQVIEPPPKEYDFAEAYQMMKAGKWMQSHLGYQRRFYEGIWQIRSKWGVVSHIPHAINACEIEDKWIEVQPSACRS